VSVKWPRIPPVAPGPLNLLVMSAAFVIFGLSLVFQPHRWASTPAYHVLLEIFTAQAWGGLFLASGVTLGAAVRLYPRRWLTVAALMLALALTVGWMLAFIVRYLTNPATTPETWVSWAVFGFLLVQAGAGLDKPRDPGGRELPEIGAYRQAVSDTLAASARNRETAVLAALEADAARLRDRVTAACDDYAAALAAVTPAGAMPAGDPARTALGEARNALLRAEEAFTRATGKSASDQDVP
jgi:hypothetical protein